MAAIAERAQRDDGGVGDGEEEGSSSGSSEGGGEGEGEEEESSSHEESLCGRKRWRPGMPDSSDEEGARQPFCVLMEWKWTKLWTDRSRYSECERVNTV